MERPPPSPIRVGRGSGAEKRSRRPPRSPLPTRRLLAPLIGPASGGRGALCHPQAPRGGISSRRGSRLPHGALARLPNLKEGHGLEGPPRWPVAARGGGRNRALAVARGSSSQSPPAPLLERERERRWDESRTFDSTEPHPICLVWLCWAPRGVTHMGLLGPLYSLHPRKNINLIF